MSCRSSDSVGLSGELHAKNLFHDLGWKIAEDMQDVGTDFYVSPTDQQGELLGLMMGVQVKTGRSYFQSKELSDKGEIVGWWYRQSNLKNEKYWLGHALPHIILLCDYDAKNCYWAELSEDAIERTGKGLKILIPANNVLNENTNSRLIQSLQERSRVTNLEGVLTTSELNMSDDVALRHALILPRLIAPSPAIYVKQLSLVEALALAVLSNEDRFKWLESARTEKGVMRETGVDRIVARLDLVSRGSWGWFALTGLIEWHQGGSTKRFETLLDGADTPTERAASVALTVSYHLDQHDVRRAYDVLAVAAEKHYPNRIDRAWVDIHKARVLMELGQLDESFRIALKVQSCLKGVQHDASARAIFAAAAKLAYSAGFYKRQDAIPAYRRSDTIAFWWRSNLVAEAFLEDVRERFSQWTDHSLPHSGRITAQKHLRSAALIAALAGDHDSWMYYVRLENQYHLSHWPSNGEDHISKSLLRLARAHSSDEAMNAADKLIWQGPMSAVAQAANSVSLADSSYSSIMGEFNLLRASEYIISDDCSEENCEWLIGRLEREVHDPNSNTDLPIMRHDLLALLSSLLPQIDAASVDSALRRISSLNLQAEDDMVDSYTKLIRAAAYTKRPIDVLQYFEPVLSQMRQSSQLMFHSVYGSVTQQIPDAVLKQLASGQISALPGVYNLELLPSDTVSIVIAALEEMNQKTLSDAEGGSYESQRFSVEHALVMLYSLFPDQANWKLIADYIRSPYIQVDSKYNAIEGIASKIAALDRSDVDRLADACEELRPSRSGFLSDKWADRMSENRDFIIAMSKRENSFRQIVDSLLVQDTNAQLVAARILANHGTERDLSLLYSFLSSRDNRLRTRAIAALTQIYLRNSNNAKLLVTLSRFFAQDRLDGAVSIMRILGESEPSVAMQPLLEVAQHFPHFLVRWRSEQVVAMCNQPYLRRS